MNRVFVGGSPSSTSLSNGDNAKSYRHSSKKTHGPRASNLPRVPQQASVAAALFPREISEGASAGLSHKLVLIDDP